MTLFTSIWIVFFSCVLYAYFFTISYFHTSSQFYFFYWINTRRQKYKRYRYTKKFLISLNWAFLRDISQKLVELLFQWRNLFCTYQQDKKIEFGTEEGLLEKHWQRWFFFNIVFNDEIIVRKTINLRVKVSCNHS